MAREEAERVKAELHIRGWTLVKLADYLDLCKQTISGVLHGKRSQRVERAIAYRPEDPRQTWLCEGEWDAMLVGWQLRQSQNRTTAVATFTCGCSAIPKQEQLDRLVGEVIIFYDLDEPGRKGAEKLAQKLGDQARMAQVPAQPNPPSGWDISDALNHGFSLSDLHSAAQKAQVFTDPEADTFPNLVARLTQVFQLESAAERAFTLESLSKHTRIPSQRLQQLWLKHLDEQDSSEPIEVHEFVRKAPQRREFLIPGLIPKASVILLVADGGTGKTLLANHVALSVALGRSWNGKPVVQGRVLIIQSDEPEVECAARLRDAGFEAVDQDQVRVKTNWQFTQMPLLKRWVAELQAALVIIDSLTAANRHSDSEEKDTSYGLILYDLRDLADQFGTTFLVLHHTNKLGIERGTTAIRNNVGEVWMLKHAERSNPQNKERQLVIDKSRSGCNDTYTLELNDDDYSWILKPKESHEGRVALEDRILEFFQSHTGIPREIEEVTHEFGCSWSSARRILKKLWRMGFLQEESRYRAHENGKGGTSYKVYLYPFAMNNAQDRPPEPVPSVIHLKPQCEYRSEPGPSGTSERYSSEPLEIDLSGYNPDRPY